MEIFGTMVAIAIVVYALSRIATFAEESRDKTILAEDEKLRQESISALYTTPKKRSEGP